ncbi:MAG: VOC family protein [Planctomycetaceae bacterium]
MTNSTHWLPDGYSSVTCYLIIRGADRAIDFYRKAFGAHELFRLTGDDGRIGHAELQIGNARVMLADEFPEMDIRGPESLQGSAVGLMLYVEDVDAVFNAAISAGASEFKPLCDQFYGDRAGTIQDPFGHRWTIATHIEDVSNEEVQRRFQDMMSGEAADIVIETD